MCVLAALEPLYRGASLPATLSGSRHGELLLPPKLQHVPISAHCVGIDAATSSSKGDLWLVSHLLDSSTSLGRFVRQDTRPLARLFLGERKDSNLPRHERCRAMLPLQPRSPSFHPLQSTIQNIFFVGLGVANSEKPPLYVEFKIVINYGTILRFSPTVLLAPLLVGHSYLVCHDRKCANRKQEHRHCEHFFFLLSLIVRLIISASDSTSALDDSLPLSIHSSKSDFLKYMVFLLGL